MENVGKEKKNSIESVRLKKWKKKEKKRNKKMIKSVAKVNCSSGDEEL